MLDSDLCIRVLRERPKWLRARFKADALCIATIAVAELLHGAGKSAKPIDSRREVERFASRLDVPPFDVDAAAHSAEIRTVLERRGVDRRL